MNDRSSRLRYPVGVLRAWSRARAAMSEEDWIDLGRHETFEAFMADFGSHMPPPPNLLLARGISSEVP